MSTSVFWYVSLLSIQAQKLTCAARLGSEFSSQPPTFPSVSHSDSASRSVVPDHRSTLDEEKCRIGCSPASKLLLI